MAHRIVRKSVYERMCNERQVKSWFTINYGIDRHFHSRKHIDNHIWCKQTKKKQNKKTEQDFVCETT